MHPVARFGLLCLFAVVPEPVSAQGPADREGVRLAVLDYVEGFYLGDTARLVRSVSPSSAASWSATRPGPDCS